MKILMLFVFFYGTILPQWEVIAPFPIEHNLAKAHFLNDDKVLVSAVDGILYKMENDFKDLTIIQTPSLFGVKYFEFVNNSVGFMIMGDGSSYGEEILKTINGGDDWFKLNNPLLFRPFSLSFINQDTGWVSTHSGILFTQDGGITWLNLTYWVATDMKFLTHEIGFAVISGKACRSIDGGITWTLLDINSPNTLSFKKFLFQDQYRGIALGKKIPLTAGLKVFITSNGGLNWEEIFNTIYTDLDNYFFEDSIIIVANNSSGKRSNDLGVTWSSFSIAEPHRNFLIRSVSFFKDKYFAFGTGGTIRKSTDEGVSWSHIGSRHGGRKIIFTDKENGFTAPWFVTTDGGKKWNLRDIVLPVPNINDYHFTNFSEGIIAYSNKIYKTTDSGISWELILELEMEAVRKFHFIDSLNGWSLGYKNHGAQYYEAGIRYTSDGGSSWSELILLSTSRDLINIFFTNKNIGFLSYDYDHPWAFRTFDGGITWILEPWKSFSVSSSFSFIDSLSGFASNYYDRLVKTTDGGVTNFLVNDDFKGDHIYFIDSLNGWATNSIQQIIRTTNGGVTWIVELENLRSKIKGFYKHDNTLFAVGENGLLMKKELNPIPVELSSFTPPTEFALLQNYPNPFNPSTKIKYQVPRTEFITLNIYDILGNEVTTLVNESKEPGEYEIEFDGSKLSSGVYFYTLRSGSFYDTKKFILMK
jgi:photosystem II stability/assembly factor-like uncharacterized protein